MNVKFLQQHTMACAIFVVSALSLIQGARGQATPLEIVNVEAYLGRWYQTYASLVVKYTFELGGKCVTADYSATDVDGTIAVVNTVRPLGGDFLSIPIEGFAVQSTDVTTQGALTVSLGPSADEADEAEFVDPGNYWIFALGPMVDEEYQWALVSNDGDQNQLYVLARDPEEFKDLYEEEVLQLCEDKGFTGFLNRPRRVRSGSSCRY